MTIQAALVTALEAIGERVVNSPRAEHERKHPFSRKYIVMSRAKGGYYFVGKGGALRVGAVVTRSGPVNEKFRKWLLAGYSPAKDGKPRITATMFDMS